MFLNINNKDFDEIRSVIEKDWGIDKEDSKNTTMLLLDYTNNDIDLCKKIIKNDLCFNRYESCESYLDLADLILSDEALKLDIKYENKLSSIKNENKAKQLLQSDGWIVSYGLAIGLDMQKEKIKMNKYKIPIQVISFVEIEANNLEEAVLKINNSHQDIPGIDLNLITDWEVDQWQPIQKNEKILIDEHGEELYLGDVMKPSEY